MAAPRLNSKSPHCLQGFLLFTHRVARAEQRRELQLFGKMNIYFHSLPLLWEADEGKIDEAFSNEKMLYSIFFSVGILQIPCPVEGENWPIQCPKLSPRSCLLSVLSITALAEALISSHLCAQNGFLTDLLRTMLLGIAREMFPKHKSDLVSSDLAQSHSPQDFNLDHMTLYNRTHLSDPLPAMSDSCACSFWKFHVLFPVQPHPSSLGSVPILLILQKQSALFRWED